MAGGVAGAAGALTSQQGSGGLSGGPSSPALPPWLSCMLLGAPSDAHPGRSKPLRAYLGTTCGHYHQTLLVKARGQAGADSRMGNSHQLSEGVAARPSSNEGCPLGTSRQ